ncbi:MAG: hypothetical protein Q8R63_05525 [Ramlibacter sp.]|nr:hypothetical protein [Ramlibacter sp.]
MDPTRNNSGGWNNLQSGATGDEQLGAGVAYYDKPWEADLKVQAARNAASATPSYGQPLVFPEYVAGSGGPLMPAGFWKWTFILLANALALLLIGVFAMAFHDANTARPSVHHPHPVFATMGFGPSFTHLFKPGTKFKVKYGQRVSWTTFQQMRSSAINPATYEQDLCSTYIVDEVAKLPQDLRPKWKVTDKGFCVADNMMELIARNERRNMLYAILAGGAALAAVVALLALNVVTLRKPRP